jgi:gas vesicle protein
MPEQQPQGIGAGSILVAFALGAAVGAAIALLTAPASGRETREVVSRRTREGREKVLEALRQGRGILDAQRESVVTAFDRARQQAHGTNEGDQEA